MFKELIDPSMPFSVWHTISFRIFFHFILYSLYIIYIYIIFLLLKYICFFNGFNWKQKFVTCLFLYYVACMTKYSMAVSKGIMPCIIYNFHNFEIRFCNKLEYTKRLHNSPRNASSKYLCVRAFIIVRTVRCKLDSRHPVDRRLERIN